jgi:hypothetical protein
MMERNKVQAKDINIDKNNNKEGDELKENYSRF